MIEVGAMDAMSLSGKCGFYREVMRLFRVKIIEAATDVELRATARGLQGFV
jgi:hypothetical protein